MKTLTDSWEMEQGSCLSSGGSTTKCLQRGHLGWNQDVTGSGLRHVRCISGEHAHQHGQPWGPPAPPHLAHTSAAIGHTPL